MKEKMNEETKAKLIYCIELAFFATVFALIAVLEFVNVIKISQTHMRIINWVTIFGGPIIIVDFIWFLISPYRRKRNSFLDKVLMIPIAIYMVVFDILCFSKPDVFDTSFAQYMVPGGISYIALIFYIQAIYHWYVPIPLLYEYTDQPSPDIKKGEDVIDVEAEIKEEDKKEE